MCVGPGTGKICDGCEQPITKDNREYEFDLPGRPTLRLHQACMEAWQVHRAIQGGSTDSFTLDTSAARIAAVLRDGFPSGFCVACLPARLDLPITEVRGAAQVVVARPGFRVVERILAYKDGERVRLVSRNRRDHTRRVRDIAAAIFTAPPR